MDLLPAPLQELVHPRGELPSQFLVACAEERQFLDDIERELRVEIHSHDFVQDVIKERLHPARVLLVKKVLRCVLNQ